MRAGAFLTVAIIAEVVATLSLKGMLTHPWLLAVIITGYVVAFSALALTLRAGMPLGVAYGVWGAIGVAATAVLSAVIFGETLTPTMSVGVVLVIAGVVVVELGAQRAGAEHLPLVPEEQAEGASSRRDSGTNLAAGPGAETEMNR